MDKELKNLIIASIKTGNLDEKKKKIIQAKAKTLGISNEELEIYIESLENELEKKSSKKSNENLTELKSEFSNSLMTTAITFIKLIPYILLAIALIAIIYWLNLNYWVLIIGLVIIVVVAILFSLS
jgi:hypothetical protein